MYRLVYWLQRSVPLHTRFGFSSRQDADVVFLVRLTVMVVLLQNGESKACFISLGFVIYIISWRNWPWSLLLFLSRGHVAVRITVAADPLDTRFLFAGFVVNAMSHIRRKDASGSASNAAYSRDFSLPVTIIPVLRKRKDPRAGVLLGVEGRSTGGASVVNRTTGKACAAWCTFVGRVIILRY